MTFHQASSPTVQASAAPLPPRRLLIVDDVPQVRRELHTLLGLACEIAIVGEAANGLEAIIQVTATHPDVVLLDLEMPVMDGYTAARRIKTLAPACRIIALTVHAYPAARARASAAGVDAFIVKGAPLATLLEEILKTE